MDDFAKAVRAMQLTPDLRAGVLRARLLLARPAGGAEIDRANLFRFFAAL